VGARQLETRTRELNNIKEWALRNNLCLNESKSVEMVFVNKKRKLAFETPPSLNEIPRKHTTKLLGVTISDDFSMSAHITSVISSCEQAMYGLRMLRHYGLNQSSIYAVFQSVILAKLTYAAPAWIGFANQGDIDRIDSFLRKCVRFNFAPPDQVSYRDLVESHEEKLFNAIISNPDHVLYSLLPPKKKNTYNMRKRAHDFVIPERESKLRDSNFILRMIHKNSF
jgi:hypothetical protein